MEKIGAPQLSPTSLNADNTSDIQIANNLTFHAHTKYIEVDCYFIREALWNYEISLPNIFTEHQTADIFTKALSHCRHQFIVDNLIFLHCLASIKGDANVIIQFDEI